MRATTYRRILNSACIAASLWFGWMQPTLAAQPTQGYNKYEIQALDVVRDWVEGWNRKDTQHFSRTMTHDAIISLPAAQNQPGATSLEKFINAYDNVERNLIQRLDILSRYAAGDAGQVVVVEKRIDHLVQRGQEFTVSVVGYFRLKDGKIVEWHDVVTGGGAPPGGAGPPRAGGPPPAAPGN
jgi:limonene-1,2-epoxide hydrolase